MLIALNKKLASRDLLSFWVLKIPFKSKTVENSQTERVNKHHQQIKIRLRIFKGATKL